MGTPIVRQYAMLMQEKAYGVPAAATPVFTGAGTNAIFVRLPSGDGYSPRMNPVFVDLKGGAGMGPTVWASVIGRYEVKGTLKCRLYASQCSFLLPWALTPINAGFTAPWATDGPTGSPPGDRAGDLASMSVYYHILYEDGTVLNKVHRGCKVAKMTLETSDQAVETTLTLDLVGKQEDGNAVAGTTDPSGTEFPAPTDSQYPTDALIFQHSASGLVVGTTRTMYGSINFSVDNTLDGRSYESSFLQVNRFLGRMAKLTSKGKLRVSPDDRTAYVGNATKTASFAMTNGTHGFAINLNGNNRFDGLNDDLDDSKLYECEFTLQTNYDATAGADLALTTS